jgi:DNA repair exonuclease SbcCD ATPase subunit
MKEVEEENNNIKINEKQKEYLRIFSKKIEEIISEFKNRKKYKTKINEEDNLKKIDFKEYDDFFKEIERQKNIIKEYKLKLNNDEKYVEMIEKKDELKYLKEDLKGKKKEYLYLIETNKQLEKFNNTYLNDEIKYYKDEVEKLRKDISAKNKEYIDYNEKLKDLRKEIDEIERTNSLIKDNIEFTRWKINNDTKNKKLANNTKNESLESYEKKIIIEKASHKLQKENLEKNYNEINKKKQKIENEVKELENELSKYKEEEKINSRKLKEIIKIENQIKLNTIKEKNRKANIKKEQIKQKWLTSKKMENLMAESLKNNFSYRNNYLQLLEDDKKQINIKRTKPGLNIAKNKMVKSNSSINVLTSKREEIKKKKEKEKEEFMSNLDKELKKHEEQKGEVIQEIKSLKEEIEKSLNSDGINDKFIDNMKKE